MSLKERITEDMKTAMRARDSARLGTIRLLLAAAKQKEVDDRLVLDDSAMIAIIDKLIKQRRDSVAAFTQAQRLDLAEREAAEITVLQAYLPERLNERDITEQVQRLVVEFGTTLGRDAGPGDMGKVMALVKARLAGKADMSQLSAAVKSALAR